MLYLLLCLAMLALGWWKLTSKPSTFPPGPYRWPVIGNMLEFKRGGRLPYEVVGDLARKYGNIVGIHLASKPVVIVSGLDEIREILNRPDCQGRPPLPNRAYAKTSTGIMFTQGEVWREQRRFALRHLRDLGLGKREAETLIQEEVSELLQDARKRAGKDFTKPIDAIDLVNATGANVIFHMLAGERFQRGEARLTSLINMIKESTKANDASGRIINAFPLLLKCVTWFKSFKTDKKPKAPVTDFIMEKVKAHQNLYNEDNQLDFIDFYLTEINKQEPGSTFHISQLLTVCFDIFAAGSDTTVGAVSFLILRMLLEPHVQQRVQAELDEVVGRERLPSLDDKARLLYVGAVMQEGLRMGNVVPLAVPHAPTEDVKFMGYFIPEGTRIIVNLYGLHMDPAIWGDPENFRPERFLGPDGELLSHEALMGFGQGKRACPGEALARTNVFLTFTALLQTFTLSVPDGEAPPSSRLEGGIALSPQPFNMTLTPRTT